MPAAVWGPLSNEKTREVGAHAPVSVFCGHQARYSCSDNGDGTHLRRQHLHSEQGDTRRSSCENTKRLNTVIATLHTAVRRCRRCRGREALGVGEVSHQDGRGAEGGACTAEGKRVPAETCCSTEYERAERTRHDARGRGRGASGSGHRLGVGTAREYSVFHHVIRVAKEKVDIGYSSVSPTALPV